MDCVLLDLGMGADDPHQRLLGLQRTRQDPIWFRVRGCQDLCDRLLELDGKQHGTRHDRPGLGCPAAFVQETRQ